MSIRRMASAAVITLTLASAAGCGSLGGPGPGTRLTDGGAGGQKDTDSHAPMQAPVLTAVPPRVCTESVAIRGTTAPGALVTVTGGAQDVTGTAGTGGSFCLDVYLTANEANTLVVRAYHESRGMSPNATIEVEHYTCGGGDDIKGPIGGDETDQPKNVALGQPVLSRDEPKSGKRTSLVDDDTSTEVTFKGGPKNPKPYNGWVFVKLDKPCNVKKIVVKWGERYGKKYDVLFSDAQNPKEVDGSWLEYAVDAVGGVDTFRIQGTVWASAIGLRLKQDNKNESWTKPWKWKKETFNIAELQVWCKPEGSGHTPEPNHTCAALTGVGP